MLKVLKIIEYGKYHSTDKLIGETIKCPDTGCGNVDTWVTQFFSVKTGNTNSFFVVCKSCGCKFIVEIE